MDVRLLVKNNWELCFMVSFKGRHFPKDIILMAVRWKLAYPLSYRNIEEMMAERNVQVDHSSIQKWVERYKNTAQEQRARFQEAKEIWNSAASQVFCV